MKKIIGFLVLALFLMSAPAGVASERPSEFKKQEAVLFNDIFNQNLYYEFVNQLDLGRLWRKVTGKKIRAKNVNLYDEVPDSEFFTNRHTKEPLSPAEIKAGVEGAPLPRAPFTITKGKTQGLHPGYFIRDAKGDDYLIKFDSTGNMELVTAAEVISGRLYHALGYNVPQYTIAAFKLEDLSVAEGAIYRDDSGFKKSLTLEKVHEQMMFVPQNRDGFYRASASKILSGTNKGSFSFRSRRKSDPNDLIHHRDLREIRALTVFAAWLNNNDVRESNTLDMLVEENGKPVLRHYLFDFNSSLGGAHGGAKPPMFGYEYMVDFGEMTKAFLSLGLWEKPWQARWREAGEEVQGAPAVGYFGAQSFNPPAFKTQLPYEAFRMLTLADGFWAAKQIAAFTDSDIRAAVDAGDLSREEDRRTISEALIARRDAIVRYWFLKSNALDRFDIQNNKMIFTDRAVEAGIVSAAARQYHVKISGRENIVLDRPELSADFSGAGEVVIRARTAGEDNLSPFVRVRFLDGRVLSVTRED